MPIFAVHAYENQYGGLHGMEEHFVVKCEELSYAQDLAEESSCMLWKAMTVSLIA